MGVRKVIVGSKYAESVTDLKTYSSLSGLPSVDYSRLECLDGSYIETESIPHIS